MGYYMGDYYRGDYYAGDPGFFSTIGGLVRRGLGAATSLIPGFGAVSKATSSIIKMGPKTTGIVERVGGLARRTGGVLIKHPVLTAAGGAGVIGATGAILGHRAGVHAGVGMRGFHISKKTGEVVRNRRMNVCNPRALRRAVRRAHSFARLAMRTIHLVHPKKKGRFGGFRVRRRKK